MKRFFAVHKLFPPKSSGFTLPELIIVIGLMGLLFGFASINLVTSQRQNQLASAKSTLIADIKTQQIKALSGDTEGESTTDDYGIYFESDQYTLFKGSVYNAASPSNFVIELPRSIQISSISLPSSQIVFSRSTGAISGYDPAQNQFVIHGAGGAESDTIVFNELGVIVQGN